MRLHTNVGQTCHVRVCAPTTVDERLQQLLLGQALVHLHPHYVTAKPLRLLPRLREQTQAGGAKTEHRKMGARCHGNKRKCSITTAPREMSQEEKVNEQRAFPNAWLSAVTFPEFYSHLQL